MRHRRALCRLHFAEQCGLSEGLYPCGYEIPCRPAEQSGYFSRLHAVFFAAPHIGLNYTQMNLVMYLIVGIVSLAGEYSEYLHTILICAIS